MHSIPAHKNLAHPPGQFYPWLEQDERLNACVHESRAIQVESEPQAQPQLEVDHAS